MVNINDDTDVAWPVKCYEEKKKSCYKSRHKAKIKILVNKER